MTDGLRARLDLAHRLRDRVSCGRFAPSPSGPLHLGNARTALLAWLQARLSGARFLMRMEDLDRPRVRPGSAAQILDDLLWLGLDWDEGPDVGGPSGPYNQSARDGIYTEALAQLQRSNAVFACVCSRRDVEQAASAPHVPSGVVYPGTCRARPPSSTTEGGRPPAWRYRVDGRRVGFTDSIAGEVVQDLGRQVGDFVVQRSDGLFAYQLAVVVDDALMGVTDVVRGMDLLDSTPRQLALFETLNLPAPRFWHVPLMYDCGGARMSKRNGAESIAAYRAQGGSAAALVGTFAATLGLAPPSESMSAPELLAVLDLTTFTASLRSTLTAEKTPRPPSLARQSHRPADTVK